MDDFLAEMFENTTVGVGGYQESEEEIRGLPVTLVPQASLALIAEAAGVKVVEAPPYDRLRDEPAFQKAWQKVAEAKAQGKLAPLPSQPPGGIRLRGSHRKSSG